MSIVHKLTTINNTQLASCFDKSKIFLPFFDKYYL